MKRLAYMAAALLALSACNNKTAERAETAETHLAQSRDSLQQMLADQDSLLVLMTEITEGMNEIKSLENIMSTPTMGKETIDKRQQIRDDMTVIQKTLLDRRQRLEELENRLNKSNNNNANLKQAIAALREQISGQQTTIESLRKDLASANIYIDELTQNVDSLNSTIVNAIEEKNEVIAENENLSNELNACYYAIGSKKELQEHNIIKSGFLRKTKIMPEDFEKTYFTQADKRTLGELPLHSKKAKVVTSQPQSSYQIIEDENGMKTLHIIDPAQFWGTSNYAVIQID